MADSNMLANLAGILGSGVSKQPELLTNERAGLTSLIPQRTDGKKSIFDTRGGGILGSLLGSLLLSGLGAGIGAIASPGHRGLGAARGAGLGAGMGVMEDIGMRKAAANAPANLLTLAKSAPKSPESIQNWEYAQTIKDPKEREAFWKSLRADKFAPVAPENMTIQDLMMLGKIFGIVPPLPSHEIK